MQLFVWISLLLVKESLSWRAGQRKQWLPDLEWSTKANWLDSSIPKSRSRVWFPAEIFHSVGLPSGQLEISAIDLPRDGSLLLARNGRLTLNNYEKGNEEVVKWRRDGPLFWADPENWNVSSEATPHFDRIPCSTDIVVLPDKNQSFSARLPNHDAEVMEIKRGVRERIDEWSWQSVMSGREFRQSRKSVRYSGLQYCGLECLCKPDMDELLDEVCSIQAPRCKGPSCEYPIKVDGHCCDYCGGRVSVPNYVASLDDLANEALKIMGDSVSWYCREQSYSGIKEVLLTENGIYSGIKSREAVDKLTKILMAEGIPIIESVSTGAPLTGSRLGNTLGPMLGVPLVILLLILVALPYFGYSYTHIIAVWREAYGSVREGIRPDETSKASGSFGFARFENLAEGDVQLASAIIPEDESSLEGDHNHDNDHEGSSGGKRFENPLYRSRRKSFTMTKRKQDISDEKIIDIDEPVSLIALQSKVHPPSETSIDSD